MDLFEYVIQALHLNAGVFMGSKPIIQTKFATNNALTTHHELGFSDYILTNYALHSRPDHFRDCFG